MGHFDRFGEVVRDGRLTVSGNGKAYRLREAIDFREQIGRLLTQEEMKRFEVEYKDSN